MRTEVLDHGFVRLVESWGKGDAGIPEAGIIEAARQSTQKAFIGWGDQDCPVCEGRCIQTTSGDACGHCKGTGSVPGDEKLLKYLSDNKHNTPFEFAGMVIEVKAPIFVFREWHRHRTQSYNEMSARYAPLPNTNYIPTVERLLINSKKNKQAGVIKGASELTEKEANQFRVRLQMEYDEAEELYQWALKAGVPKELARVHLPVGRYSQMRAQTNLRNWLGFLTLRMDPAAQWEIRQYANAVGKIIETLFPHTWELFVNAFSGADRE